MPLPLGGQQPGYRKPLAQPTYKTPAGQTDAANTIVPQAAPVEAQATGAAASTLPPAQTSQPPPVDQGRGAGAAPAGGNGKGSRGTILPLAGTDAAKRIANLQVTGGAQGGGNTPDQMWNDIMAQYDQEGKNIGNIANAYESNASRRASEMAQGSATGGGFAAGMAQAAIGGEQNREKLNLDYQKQGLDLKMTYLRDLIKNAQNDKDRQNAIELLNRAQESMYNLELLKLGQSPLSDPEFDAMMRGDTSPGSGGSGGGSSDASKSAADKLRGASTMTAMNRQDSNGQNGWSSLDSWNRDFAKDWPADKKSKAYAAAQSYVADYFDRHGEYPTSQVVQNHLLATGDWR